MFFVRRLAKTFLLALIIIKSANAQLTEVKTDSGAYLGYSSEHVEGVIAYKGIGYAAPPVGDLRWKPPAPAIPSGSMIIGSMETTMPGSNTVSTSSRNSRPASRP